MKSKIKLYISFVLTIFLLSSCGTLTKSKTYAPGQVQLNIDMADLEYLGETKIDVTYRTYLGFIRVIDSVNGEVYDQTNIQEAKLCSQIGSSLLTGPINKATTKLIKKYPDATYFQPISQTKIKERLFLGSQVTVKALVKAYKFNAQDFNDK